MKGANVYFAPTSGGTDPHVSLIQQLCEAIATFVEATEAQRQRPIAAPSAPTANDNLGSEPRHVSSAKEVIGMKGLLVEYGLKQPQIAKLRKAWGFPAPISSGRPLLFLRSEVEHWASAQPNRSNLAIVLRCRKRPNW